MLYPEKGTPESHEYYLRKLYKWLKINPKNNPVVDDEAAAVAYAYEQTYGKPIDQ